MKAIHWFWACLTLLALGVAFKLGQHIERENEKMNGPRLRITAQHSNSITYDASQYAPEAFEQTNIRLRKAIERGDYPKNVQLICVYPTGVGADTIVVAGDYLSDNVCEAIFEDVRKSLDKYPRIPRYNWDKVLDGSEANGNAEAGAGQPATAPESKSEGNQKPHSESKPASR